MTIRLMRRRLVGPLAAAPLVLMGFAISVGAEAASPHAAVNSVQVAYVHGSNTSAVTASSDNYFKNTGQTCTGAGPCTYSSTGGTVTFTDVPMTSLNGSGTIPNGTYDTVFIYMVCDLSAAPNATALGKINTFLGNGGKTIIFDADGCSPSTDYSQFGPTASLAFATNNPGAHGANSRYTFVEADDLTKASAGQAALVAGFSPQGDSLGDANVFTTSNGNWCGADSTVNNNGVNGWVTAYSKPGVIANGGLAIYIGEDVRFHGSGLPAHDAQTVGNALSAINPGGNLPCSHNANTAPPNTLLPSPSPPALPRSGSAPDGSGSVLPLWSALILLVAAPLIAVLRVRQRKG